MKLAIVAAALAAALCCPPAMAESREITIRELTELSGVSPYNLRLVFGAHSTPGVYPLSHDRAMRQWAAAVERLASQGIVVSEMNGKLTVTYTAEAVAAGLIAQHEPR